MDSSYRLKLKAAGSFELAAFFILLIKIIAVNIKFLFIIFISIFLVSCNSIPETGEKEVLFSDDGKLISQPQQPFDMEIFFTSRKSLIILF